MALLYRAMWRTEVQPSDEAIATCEQNFRSWAETTQNSKDRQVQCIQSFPKLSDAIELNCVDHVDSQVWRTMLRARVVDGYLHILVENYYEGDDIATRIAVARPRIVEDLLKWNKKPSLGQSALLLEPIDISGEMVKVLIEQLQNPERKLPVIVFTPPPGEDRKKLDIGQLARQVARRAAGVAMVITLDDNAVSEFKRQLGSLAVWGGGVRTYTPGEWSDSEHLHRFIPWRKIITLPSKATENRLVYLVTQQSTRRRICSELTGSVWDSTDTGALETSLAKARKETDEALDMASMYEQRTLELEQELRETLKRLRQSEGQLKRLRKQFEEKDPSGMYHVVPFSAEQDDDDLLEDTSVVDALKSAQIEFAGQLEIPDEILNTAGKLDVTELSVSWGASVWRALKALDTYVLARHSEQFNGDFWRWCINSGDPNVLAGARKNVAMTESDTVENSAKLRSTRIFPVCRDIDPDGKIYMGAHIKISNSGGQSAPRLYFHDATDKKEGKVHIGFVGPHYLVPNTKS